METRRRFVKKILGLLAGLGWGLEPLVLKANAANPPEGKTVVPRGTAMEALRGMNHADLDTGKLDVIPLDKFGTMGLEDHEVDIDKWRLLVEGHVGTGLSLTYSDLLAQPPIERTVLMICPGFFANNGKWKGVSVGELLAKAEPKAEVTHVTFRGPSGNYQKVLRVPIEHIRSNQVFLAYEVNGQSLPQKHGFPLRLVAEGYYGYDWVKYVDKVVADKIET